MTRKLISLAVLAIAIVAGYSIYSRSAEPPNPMGAAFAQDDAAEVDTSSIVEMSIGNPDAAVTVIEYASFTCPHCANFHADSFKKLKADFIDTDRINFVYREVYFDRFGLWASIVARCGEGAENRFFGITDLLYEQQGEWARQSEAADIVESLRRIGKTAGLSDGQLDACLQDGDKAQALYALWLQRSEEDGINSTPTFIIDGTKHANLPYDDMNALIEDALADG